jgi:peptide/nickel transport system substrate-binding protein
MNLIHRALAAAAVLGALAAPALAQTLRIASAFDPQTMDPHALALLYHSRVAYQVTSRWSGATRLQARTGARAVLAAAGAQALALQAAPGREVPRRRTIQRRRRGLLDRTHAGQDLAARLPAQGRDGRRKVDPLTVDLQLDAPDAVLPEKLQYISIMSRAWAEQHGVTQAQDFNGKQETHAVRHANGTGPYASWRATSPTWCTVLQRHDGWWGRGDPRTGNLAEVRFVTIKSDATRLAALASARSTSCSTRPTRTSSA